MTLPATLPLRYINSGGTAWVRRGRADISLGGGTSNPRDALTYGSYKPDGTTTGYLSGTTLVPYGQTGDITISTGGTAAAPLVIEGKDIVGRLLVKAPYVTIRNNRITYDGSTYSANTALIDASNANVHDLIIQDNEISGKAANGAGSLWIDGILGQGFAAYRNNIHHTVDGAGWSTDGIVFKGNWIHDLAGFLVDPNHSNGPTHNDCLQIQGGNNQTILGNNLDGTIASDIGDGSTWAANGGMGGQYGGSCIQTNRATSNITTGWVIDRNWADNARFLFNLSSNGLWASNNSTAPYPVFDSVSNNRFGHNSNPGSGGYNDNFTIYYAAATTLLTSSGNVYDDNGIAVHIRNNASV